VGTIASLGILLPPSGWRSREGDRGCCLRFSAPAPLMKTVPVRSRMTRMRRSAEIPGTLASLILLGVMLLAVVGDAAATAPGPREGRVIVRLPVSADLSTGPTRAVESRRRAIGAARSRLVEQLGPGRWKVMRSFEHLPYVALDVDAAALERLRRSPHVEEIFEDRLERIQLGEAAPLIQADLAFEKGWDGDARTVVLLDTGVDANHPFLGGRVVDGACFSRNATCRGGGREEFGIDAGRPCEFADSACKHGTHVAGVIAGDGQTVDGIARGTTIASVQVFSSITGEECEDDFEDPCARTFLSDVLRGLEWSYEMRDVLPIAAVNLSLGGGFFTSVEECEAGDRARKEAIELLREAGIVTVAAAGNDGAADGLTAPACIRAAVSVGATNDENEVASFSNTATFLDFLAPGSRILSSIPGEGGATLSGSSQAAPMVSAAFALLRQAVPEATVDQMFDALSATGKPILDDRNGRSYPLIQIVDAIRELVDVAATSAGLRTTPDGLRTLVSKQVGDDRWAITFNQDDRTITGNVFPQGGGDPSFVWCGWAGDDGASEPYDRTIFFDCQGADACSSATCSASDWVGLGRVGLPYSFLLPPLSFSSGGETSSPGPGSGTSVPAGVRPTPNLKQILLNKDVGGERWAITRNEDDQSVTGNVFTAGEAPVFLYCEKTGDNGDPDPAALLIDYRCWVADRCYDSLCAPSEWKFSQDVVIPGWFFDP
jgi:subtilisin